QLTLTGKVSAEDGLPLPGVNVIIEGTSAGTTTDADGHYSLSVNSNDAVLVFSFIGYKSQRIVIGNQTTINLTLEADVQSLQEVVVTGYRAQSRGTITGSVASVNSQEFEDVPTGNLSNALAGRLTGVTITTPSGTPGMESKITIRSMGTFNNADPLFVIDGVIRDKYAFDALSPTEVEDISILKDGASAAIYGSRAANGVVLVTTKRGSNQAPSLNFSSSFGIQAPTRIPEALNAYEHATLINDGLAYQYFYNDNFVVPQGDARLYAQDELDYFKENSWNWVEELWQTPITTQHALNINGGSDNVRYFLGGSYIYATGSFENLDYRKLNLRGNVDVDVTRNLTVSLDLSTDNRSTHGPSWDVGNWRQEDLYKALVLRSNMVPPLVNGMPTGNWVEWSPVAVINGEAGYNDTGWAGLNSTIMLNYKVPFVDGLGVNMKYNRYQRDELRKQFNLPYEMTVFNTLGSHNHIVGDQPVGVRPRAAQEFLLNRNEKINTYQFNLQLNYKKNFGDHNLDAFLVYEQWESDERWFQGRRDNFVSPSVDQYVGGGRGPEEQQADGREVELARLSYVGSVNYDFKEKYLLQGSFRYDGSVIFAPENRWGFFPSGSFGWRVSKEPFFASGFIDDLMLRGSVGLLGNDDVGSFQWLQSFNIVDGAGFNGVSTALEPGVLANRAITWEKSLSYNAGLNARLLNNSISFKADFFLRQTYDILGDRESSIPSTFGASLPDENYQEVDTKGFEIELGYNNFFGSADNRINYYLRGNFAYARNEIIKLDEAENLRPYQSKLGRPIGLADNYTTNISRLDILFGYVATDIIRTQEDLETLPEGYTILGEAPRLGMLNYRDVRGPNSDSPDGRITVDDREYLGKFSIPPMNYGFSVGLSWRSLKLDALVQGVAGHQIMLHANARRVQGRAEESTYRFWADHWTPENTDAAYPAARRFGWPPTDFPSSSWFMRSGAFVRLKNVNLSCDLPQGIINKLKMKSVRLFYNGTNLALLHDNIGDWNHDPELNNIRAYPMMATHSLGLNIGL
ncbi:MAG TPA: TonB-dependent receptor, partial [Chryseosolibacter sp.]